MDKDKDRKTEDTVCYDTVDLIGNSHLISASLNVCGNNFLDVLISSICYDTLCIIIFCLLKVGSDLLDLGLSRSRKVKTFFYLAVSLEKFYCIPSLVLLRDVCRNQGSRSRLQLSQLPSGTPSVWMVLCAGLHI